MSIFRFWNKLIKLPINRLTKQVFLLDCGFKRVNWSVNAKKLFDGLNLLQDYELYQVTPINRAKDALHNKYVLKWQDTINQRSKLKIYRMFKSVPKVENYLHIPSRAVRSIIGWFIAQFRCGILPLEIETGR